MKYQNYVATASAWHEPSSYQSRCRWIPSKRREALSAYVKELAQKVIESGVEKGLEPMNAADRKVVHDAANEVDGVGTISVGDEPRRRVVLVVASD